MAGFGMVFGLIGSMVSAAGASQQAQGQADAQEAQARAQEANAAAQRKRAMEERAAASINAERKMRDGSRLVSEQVARFASSGGGLGGTASTVIGNTFNRGRTNSNLVVWEGEQKARGYEDQAAIGDYSAARLIDASNRTRSNAGIGVASALLSGVSRIGGSFTAPAENTASGYYYG
mgnify:CR=1 FL=1